MATKGIIQQVTIYPAATTTANSGSILPEWTLPLALKMVVLMKVASLTAGSATFTPKLQFFDAMVNDWVDVPDGAFDAFANGNHIMVLGAPVTEATGLPRSTIFPPLHRMRLSLTWSGGAGTTFNMGLSVYAIGGGA